MIYYLSYLNYKIQNTYFHITSSSTIIMSWRRLIHLCVLRTSSWSFSHLKDISITTFHTSFCYPFCCAFLRNSDLNSILINAFYDSSISFQRSTTDSYWFSNFKIFFFSSFRLLYVLIKIVIFLNSLNFSHSIRSFR